MFSTTISRKGMVKPEIKYFSESQIRLLRKTVKDKAAADKTKKNVTGIREWLVIDILTATGLRVDETSNLRCGDVKLGYDQCEVFVRSGKGGRQRTVEIPVYLKKHLKEYLNWKKDRKEGTGENDHLFVGQRGPWTAQAIQQIVKKYLRKLKLYEKGKSVHSLRHSYAVQLYSKQRDLRAVQKQLGHASIQTTQIYADVTKEDIQKQINGLW